MPEVPSAPDRPEPADGPGAAGNWPGDEDWDQEASLAASVAAAESGDYPPPPEDGGPADGLRALALPVGGLPEGLWQFVPAEDGGPAGAWQPVPLDQDGVPLTDDAGYVPARVGDGPSGQSGAPTSTAPGLPGQPPTAGGDPRSSAGSGDDARAACPGSTSPGDGDASPDGDDAGGSASSVSPGPSRPGAGFGCDGAWDRALPGPGLASAVDAAAGQAWRYPDMTDDELIGTLTAWQKLEAWCAAGKLAAGTELIRRRPDEHGDGQLSPDGAPPASWGKYAGDEAAAALSISPQAAGRMLALAHDLAARLPLTAKALREGLITEYKAQVIAEILRALDNAAAAAAEQILFAGDGAKITGKTPSQIRIAAGRAAASADPEAARKRREEAVKDARVELWREDAGTAALCGFHLPPDEALAADQHITVLARALKAAGLPGGMDAARVRAYLDILLGKNTLATLQAQQARQDAARQDRPGQDRPGQDRTPGGPCPQAPGQGSPRASAPGQDGPGQGGPEHGGTPGGGSPASGTSTGGPAPGDGQGGDAPGPQPNWPGAPGSSPADQPGSPATATGGPGGAPARINLTIPAATLLGLADRPGEATGFGPLDPALARALAHAAAADPATTWCVTVTGQHGHPTAHGCAHPDRPGTRREAKTSGTGPPGRGGTRPPGTGSTGPPERNTGPPGTGSTGHPGPDSTGPPGAGDAGLPADHPPGPAGQARTRDQDGPGFTLTPAPGQAGRWRLHTPGDRSYIIDLESLPVTGCDHRHRTPAYQPGGNLRHLVSIRDGECTYPPCRRAAEACDLDHTLPYDQGGPSCGCNLAARCRRHHRAKQAPGWQARQDQPGQHTWTTPAGRTYTSGPATYPI